MRQKGLNFFPQSEWLLIANTYRHCISMYEWFCLFWLITVPCSKRISFVEGNVFLVFVSVSPKLSNSSRVVLHRLIFTQFLLLSDIQPPSHPTSHQDKVSCQFCVLHTQCQTAVVRVTVRGYISLRWVWFLPATIPDEARVRILFKVATPYKERSWAVSDSRFIWKERRPTHQGPLMKRGVNFQRHQCNFRAGRKIETQ